jgi:phosphoenolpyruvate synthase/pyruvate phosphate dikinase
MTKMGLPVPLSFTLSLKVEERFLRETNADQEIRNFKDDVQNLQMEVSK